MFSILLITLIVGGIVTKSDEEGSGGFATLIMTMAFVFIPKNNVVNLLVGIPFERALQWHKALGVFSVIMGAYHGLVVGKVKSDTRHVSGLILVIAMGVLVVMSFFKFRRAFYTWFYRIHMILVVIILGYALIHGAGGVFFGAGLWGFDLLVRMYMKRKHKKVNRTMFLEDKGDGLLKLSF